MSYLIELYKKLRRMHQYSQAEKIEKQILKQAASLPFEKKDKIIETLTLASI